ncbi:hypothetical protein BLNAU_3615 [Blattamonas nauphoetae]|uniref:Uncharacterized protein n=1 Tax=Blattamonas nauphoetae TaxID=2049346 RepID=A0ABQ9YCS5_9EUKA|nr:hypothetical protein BLNAU_3615 [Blattamonas nauphoetae]
MRTNDHCVWSIPEQIRLWKERVSANCQVFWVNTKDGPGKEPLISTDMKKLIASVPAGCKHNAEDVSLWRFAHQTGARAISCEALTLRDIFPLKCDEDGRMGENF